MPYQSLRSVKLILPALTEATSPYWRPIKYSLFPPLGLATLAAYLDPDLEISLQDEHVEKLDLNDQPDLHPARGRRPCRDFPSSRPTSLLPRRSPFWKFPVCARSLPRHEGDGPCLSGSCNGRLDP